MLGYQVSNLSDKHFNTMVMVDLFESSKRQTCTDVDHSTIIQLSELQDANQSFIAKMNFLTSCSSISETGDMIATSHDNTMKKSIPQIYLQLQTDINKSEVDTVSKHSRGRIKLFEGPK